MGKYDFRPSRVQQTAAQLLTGNKSPKRPPWYDVIASNPPPQILVRTQPVQHTGHRSRTKKPSKLFKPQNIIYPEDSLRKTFFSDHPWELARPRVILEDSGADHRRQQWETVRQRGGHLSGENVVQRQAWLIERENMSKDDAYDQARREFYSERLREEVERRVAREEAMATGAYFGKTVIGIGNDLEDQEFEKFRGYAQKAIIEMEATRSAGQSSLEAGIIEGPEIQSAITDLELPAEGTAAQPESTEQKPSPL